MIPIWNFGGSFHFKLWVFASNCEYFCWWHWKALLKCCKVYIDTNDLKSLDRYRSIILSFEVVKHTLAHLNKVFQNLVVLVQENVMEQVYQNGYQRKNMLKSGSHFSKKFVSFALKKPFKNDVKYFLFHFISFHLFVLKICRFLFWFFGDIEKAAWLER